MSQLPGHVEGYPREKWEASMAVDGTGYFRMTQLFLEDMLKAGGATSSRSPPSWASSRLNARLYPNRGGLDSFRPNYSYAKAGVVGFTRFIAAAYADRNIRANCLSPAASRTPETPPDEAPFAERTPMGRFGAPEEMKGPIVFLASDASSFMTGHNLVVDGGYTVGSAQTWRRPDRRRICGDR